MAVSMGQAVHPNSGYLQVWSSESTRQRETAADADAAAMRPPITESAWGNFSQPHTIKQRRDGREQTTQAAQPCLLRLATEDPSGKSLGVLQTTHPILLTGPLHSRAGNENHKPTTGPLHSGWGWRTARWPSAQQSGGERRTMRQIVDCTILPPFTIIKLSHGNFIDYQPCEAGCDRVKSGRRVPKSRPRPVPIPYPTREPIRLPEPVPYPTYWFTTESNDSAFCSVLREHAFLWLCLDFH
jgi:hypothetical protein